MENLADNRRLGNVSDENYHMDVQFILDLLDFVCNMGASKRNDSLSQAPQQKTRMKRGITIDCKERVVVSRIFNSLSGEYSSNDFQLTSQCRQRTVKVPLTLKETLHGRTCQQSPIR
jgi:hypothetical protein